jgi:hypothetical protein
MSTELVERVAGAKLLQPDEEALAALRVNAVGTKTAAAWLATAGTAAVPPVDEALPVGYLLVVTDRRVIAARCTLTGRPKSLAAEWPVDGAWLEYEDRGERARVRRLALYLANHAIVCDAPINGTALDQAEEFLAGFARLAALATS